MKKLVITIVLCLVSVGMLSGCVNPLDPKEQFIGTWEVTEGEASIVAETPAPTALLFIFHRNDTLELRMVFPDQSSSLFFLYEINTLKQIRLTAEWSQEELTFGYAFSNSNTLILTFVDTGDSITLHKVS